MKFCLRVAIGWYIPSFAVRGKVEDPTHGPVLLVANHPDSFLDAILIALSCSQPMHFLARGDVFNKPWHRWLLRQLNMYPVYRIREGRQHVHLNRTSFQYANEVLSARGTLLIFIEGICLNTHELQPFKKGAGRIALEAAHFPGFRIIPVGVAYSDFRRIGKAATVCFGTPLRADQLFSSANEQSNIHQLNAIIFPILQKLIQPPVARPNDKPTGLLSLILPLSRILNFPLFYPISRWVASLTSGTVFYDSVLFAVLLLTYPLYLICIFWILSILGCTVIVSLLLTLSLPATAYYALSRRLELYYKDQAVSS